MTFVARVLALGLAVLWLPLTLHCSLACLILGGDEPTCCQQDGACSGGGECHSDLCKIIESGNYFIKPVPVPVAATPVDWTTALDPAALPGPACSLATLNESTGAPPGWNRIWQFARRAAPAARAPAARCC